MSLFDTEPSTTSTTAAGAIDLTSFQVGSRKTIHYFENIWDPDTMPADDFNKYVVPKEGELVIKTTGNQIQWLYVYKVYQNKSDLRDIYILNSSGDTTEDQDTIFGSKGGPLAGEGIMGVDYSVRPPRARIDGTIMRPDATHAYLFLGDVLDLDNNASIISAVYDSSNNLLSNKIPVILAAINNYTNKSIFTTDQFSVTLGAESLPDGTRCTLVFFNNEMPVPPSQRVMVQQSSYLRDRELGVRYITDIELVSPWFTDSNNPDTIMLPITTPISGITFTALVHYSDGEPVEYPVNGNKFQLLGMDEYRPSFVGQRAELQLIYTLSNDEQFYIAQPGVERTKFRVYNLVADYAQDAYASKIYTYPYWIQQGSIYGLQHFLYNLDRLEFVDVSSLVTINESSPIFRPNAFNTLQDLTFNLLLSQVSPTYKASVYKQTTGIVLYNDVNGPGRRWGVQYDETQPIYDSLFGKLVNNGANTTINVTNGFTTVTDWLAALYTSVVPSFDQFSEEKAPTPDKFYIMLPNGTRYPAMVANWNQNISLPASQLNGQTAYICWVKTDSTGNEKQLAITGIVMSTS